VNVNAMDRELGRGYRWRRALRRVAVASGAAGVVVAGVLLLADRLRPSLDGGRLRTAVVERGRVDGTVEASGTVVPAFEKVLSSPVEARVVRILKRPGESVAPGDEVLELDTAASRTELARLDDLLAQKAAQREELRLGLEAELAELGSRIETGRLDVEILRHGLANDRQLAGEGLLADEALRESEVSARKAEIGLRQLEESMAPTRRVHAARLRGLGLDLDILRGQRDAIARELELATARADRVGVLTWVVREEGATVRRGEVIARIADLDSFGVEATVSDVHAARLAEGLPCRVLVDGEPLEGRLGGVHPTIENGIARFDVELDQPSFAKLRNNLRVDVLVVTDSRADALRLPRGSFSGGVEQVFVVEGDRAVRRRVRFGLVGYEHAEVLEGLAAGEEVVLSDTSDVRHLDELEIDR
jgi:HlyD family secretion protein